MNNPPPGKLIIIVAPSGTGKSTMANRLLNDFDRIRFSVSATTRAPREGEIDGQHYFFLDEEEFTRLVEEGGLLEWEYYSGNRYGTLRREVDKLMESGYFPLLDIEVKGALNVQQMYEENCLSIFLEPPSMDELKQRLLNRKSEDVESLESRLRIASEEMKYANRFDYVVVNDDLEEAYSEIKEIVTHFIETNT